MTRVTLRFKSDNGGDYLYDDVTGNIFPWGPTDDAILNQELGVPLTDSEQRQMEGSPIREVKAKTNYIRQWRTQYQAFARDVKTSFPAPSPEEVKNSVWANSQVLLIILTEDCNLNCSYCCFASGTYPQNRKPSKRSMTFECAAKAVDWYVANKSAVLARDPRRQFGLSFYGGEPLMNIKLVEQIMGYVQQHYPGLFIPVLTTNGTLLTPKNVEVLAKYNIKVGVSLDGPQEEHDRLRVDHRGHGTYKRVLSNLARIKQTNPEYWKTLVCISTFDPGTDIEKNAKFFDENKDVVPKCMFANEVSRHNTEYYNRYNEEDFATMNKRLWSLRQKYKKERINGNDVNGYHHGIAGGAMTLVLARSRFQDYKPFIPYTACCIPGARMAVNVDGKLDMCERVSGVNSIGHIDRGLDYIGIGRLIQKYQENVLRHCAECPASRLCSLCFSYAEGRDGRIEKPSKWCDTTVGVALRNLSDYISILESDGTIKSIFEWTSLENRTASFLFQG